MVVSQMHEGSCGKCACYCKSLSCILVSSSAALYYDGSKLSTLGKGQKWLADLLTSDVAVQNAKCRYLLIGNEFLCSILHYVHLPTGFWLEWQNAAKYPKIF